MDDVNKATGEVKKTLVEMTAGLPGQMDIFGNVVEPEAIQIIDIN